MNLKEMQNMLIKRGWVMTYHQPDANNPRIEVSLAPPQKKTHKLVGVAFAIDDPAHFAKGVINSTWKWDSKKAAAQNNIPIEEADSIRNHLVNLSQELYCDTHHKHLATLNNMATNLIGTLGTVSPGTPASVLLEKQYAAIDAAISHLSNPFYI